MTSSRYQRITSWYERVTSGAMPPCFLLMSCCLHCSVCYSRFHCTCPGRPIKTIPGSESLHICTILFLVSAPYVLPLATASFKLRPPTPLPTPKDCFCFIHPGNYSDRTYLRCPVRASIQLRCLEGVWEW